MSKKDRDESRKFLFNIWDKLSQLKTSLITYQGQPGPSNEDYFKVLGTLVVAVESAADLLIYISYDFDELEERLARLERASGHPTPPGLRNRR